MGVLNPLGATAITANTISFSGGAASVHGTSTLLLQPAANGTTVSVGGAGGTLVINAADLAALASGFTQVQIGRSDGTAAVTVVASATFTSPVLLQSSVGGSVVLDGNLSAGANAVTSPPPPST